MAASGTGAGGSTDVVFFSTGVGIRAHAPSKSRREMPLSREYLRIVIIGENFVCFFVLI
jgi:hypothetical protein